ncbi:MAG: hypothetical protein JWO62_1690 [Acidimicrobiaceae bacterium]|nr:hypothetical protein [Acidimicrobiaceae bacterium]
MTGPTTEPSAVVAPAVGDAVASGGPAEAVRSTDEAASTEGDSSQADELEQAIQSFLAEMGSGVVSVSRVVNPLLQVWSVARDVDAVVAVPVENLLTVLVGRALTTSQELTDTMTEVRAVLAGTSPLATV